MIGKLKFLLHIQPDLSYVIQHYEVDIHVFRYHKSTPTKGLFLTKMNHSKLKPCMTWIGVLAQLHTNPLVASLYSLEVPQLHGIPKSKQQFLYPRLKLSTDP